MYIYIYIERERDTDLLYICLARRREAVWAYDMLGRHTAYDMLGRRVIIVWHRMA